ncbi:MAG TPA: hypothetical protein VFK54_11355 [Candidatus Limnocylindrales bacterium]|nr:hypothetical protein [Candidatus Limnocylindrales bacterium]
MTHPRDERADVLAVDRYLDALLSSADDRAPGGRADLPDGPAIDAALAATATRLRRDLVRIHPSFRFEERLAARLAASAAGRRAAAGAEGVVIPFRGPRSPGDPAGDPAEDALLAAIAAGTIDPAVSRPAPPAMPILIGGALTSAALSIAGVAWMAWRASHRNARGTPMARAARAAHRRAHRSRARSIPAPPRGLRLS